METSETYSHNKRRFSKKIIFYFSLSFLFLILFQASSAQYKYIQKYTGLADSLSEAYGIPTAVILGIAIVESSFGTSRNCKLLNNHFGIVGRNNLLRKKGIKTRYKQYPDAKSSYIDFCRLMTTKRFYPKLKGNMDYKLWIEAISRAKYSEIPLVWKHGVLFIIKKYKLSAASNSN